MGLQSEQYMTFKLKLSKIMQEKFIIECIDLHFPILNKGMNEIKKIKIDSLDEKYSIDNSDTIEKLSGITSQKECQECKFCITCVEDRINILTQDSPLQINNKKQEIPLEINNKKSK